MSASVAAASTPLLRPPPSPPHLRRSDEALRRLLPLSRRIDLYLSLSSSGLPPNRSPTRSSTLLRARVSAATDGFAIADHNSLRSISGSSLNIKSSSTRSSHSKTRLSAHRRPHSKRRQQDSTSQVTQKYDNGEGLDIDEDAFEALFSQLEQDLKNGNLSGDEDDDEITEEDLARLEQELEDALGDDDNPEFSEVRSSSDEEAEEEERLPKLKNWQLRRLAYALKIGKRKTSIKILAAELGLDRALVLELLRDPPPNLLLLSASLPDEVKQKHLEPESKPVESPVIIEKDAAGSKPELGLPVHVMQSRWIMQKRLKKVQVETLERVYSRTKRPTNTMISSIIHVTNLPRKRVVQWFEDKRQQDGVPKHRSPFRRSMPETITNT